MNILKYRYAIITNKTKNVHIANIKTTRFVLIKYRKRRLVFLIDYGIHNNIFYEKVKLLIYYRRDSKFNIPNISPYNMFTKYVEMYPLKYNTLS